MPIQFKTLPPAVQGADYARLLQGVNADGSKPTADNPSTFLPADTLTATISQGQNLPSLFAPTCSWFNAPLAQVGLAISGAQSAQLAIDAPYLLEIFGSRGSTRYPIVVAYLPILPSAGSQVAAIPPDLIGIPYLTQLLAQLALGEPQLEAIPTLIAAASDAVRDWCNRRFTAGVYVETVPVISGLIRLSQTPLRSIDRVQCSPRVALTVGNASSSVQQAWVSGTATGGTLTGYVPTALTLNWTSGGTLTAAPITFAAGQTIAGVAAAIGAVGSGWSATADPILGFYPATDLFDVLDAKGAGPDDTPDGGALYHVYGSNASDFGPVADDGMGTGLVRVGRIGSSSQWGAWGPGGFADDGWGGGGSGPGNGQVRVTYSGGFDSIPREVMLATGELVKAQLERLGTELILKSETGDKYSYEINEQMLMALPTHVLQALGRHRITNA